MAPAGKSGRNSPQMTVTIENEQVFEDGGYSATVNSFGFVFGVNFVAGEIRAHGLNVSQYGHKGWKLGASHKKAVAAVDARLEQLGPEFMAKHRALYELN
jgi:hypothetical protein